MRFNAFYSKSLPACLPILYSYAWLATLLLAFPTCKRSVTYPTTPVVAATVRFSHRPFYPSAGQARHPSAFQIDGFTEKKKKMESAQREAERAGGTVKRIRTRMSVCSQIYASDLDNFIHYLPAPRFRLSANDARFMIYKPPTCFDL